jgi:hypothetical protein
VASLRWKRNTETGREIRMHLRKLIVALAVVFIGALLLTAPALAARFDGADHGGRPLSTTLTGTAEVPDPGDPDGSGEARITVNPGQGEICWEIEAAGIELPALSAHIHEGAVGVAGDVVVTLTPPVEVGDDGSGFSSGCTTVERELAFDILKNPENYYVNVHTDEFPAGAIRGQL